MNSFVSYISRRCLLVSCIGAIFVVYPNLVCLGYEVKMLAHNPKLLTDACFFLFKYSYFCALFYLLIRYNLHKLFSLQLKIRFCHNILLGATAYALFLLLYHFGKRLGIHDYWASMLTFQFFVVCAVCSLLGHISMLYLSQQEKEFEIERLKRENLQSRCDALRNQINPHFFFNSLSGISSLIRKKDDRQTLQYVDELADVFRYILHSEHKELVPLAEELRFVEAFRYVMEVRFANKLEFRIDVDSRKCETLMLPVLSLLPLIDNVIVHNRMDGDHKMHISITLNEDGELIVSNPVYKKMMPPETNGTGLKNLEKRFALLKNTQIRIAGNDGLFSVSLPLKSEV